MIPFYLSLLPGEHIYSWWIRLYWLSGRSNKALYFKEIGVKPDELKANIPLTKSCQKVCQLSAIILNNNQIAVQATELPLWVLSMSFDRYRFFRCRVHKNQVPANLHVANHSGVIQNLVRWKACPKCTAEDLERYGASYWHVKHQIHGVSVCNKHSTLLITPKQEGRTLKSISLPHQIRDWESLIDVMIPQHYLFSEFCSNVYELALKDSDLLILLKNKFWKICGVEEIRVKDRKSLIESLELEIEAELGNYFLSSIFSYYSSAYKTKRRKIVYTLYMSTNCKYVDPVFWLVTLFWKRKELGLIEEFFDEPTASIQNI
jgi:hypothetical protein